MNFLISYQDYSQKITATNYIQLVKAVKQKFKYLFEKFNLYYIDEENDKIVISNQDDFENVKNLPNLKLLIETGEDIEELEVISQSSGEILYSGLNESLLKLKQMAFQKRNDMVDLDLKEQPVEEIPEDKKVTQKIGKVARKQQKKKQKKSEKNTYCSELTIQEKELETLHFQLSVLEDEKNLAVYEINMQKRNFVTFEEIKPLRMIFNKSTDSIKKLEFMISQQNEETQLSDLYKNYSQVASDLNQFLTSRLQTIQRKKGSLDLKVTELQSQLEEIEKKKTNLVNIIEEKKKQLKIVSDKLLIENSLDKTFRKEIKQKKKQEKMRAPEFYEDSTKQQQNEEKSESSLESKESEPLSQQTEISNLDLVEQPNLLECSRIFGSEVMRRAEFLGEILGLEKNKLYRFVKLHEELNDEDLILAGLENIVGITEL